MLFTKNHSEEKNMNQADSDGNKTAHVERWCDCVPVIILSDELGNRISSTATCATWTWTSRSSISALGLCQAWTMVFCGVVCLRIPVWVSYAPICSNTGSLCTSAGENQQCDPCKTVMNLRSFPLLLTFTHCFIWQQLPDNTATSLIKPPLSHDSLL